MSRIAIIADSIANLPPDKVQQYGLNIIPINIHCNGKIYRDGVDLNSSEAYRLLAENPEHFYSSPAPVGEYLAVFKKLAASADGIICVTLSSRLSGMHNVALLAKRQAVEESIGVPVEVLDSRNATVGEGLVVTAVAEAALSGKSLSEVVNIGKAVIDKVKLIGAMDTVRYVYRTGRIPELAARLGSMLSIRPYIKITDGAVRVTGTVRNRESGIARMIRQMKRDVQSRPVHVAISQASLPEDGERFRRIISSEFNCVETWITDFSPVMAYATGMGVLVVAYYTEN